MEVIFYAGPCCGMKVTTTWRPQVGDPVAYSNVLSVGGIYLYAGKGRYVYGETLEARIIRESCKTRKDGPG